MQRGDAALCREGNGRKAEKKGEKPTSPFFLIPHKSPLPSSAAILITSHETRERQLSGSVAAPSSGGMTGGPAHGGNACNDSGRGLWPLAARRTSRRDSSLQQAVYLAGS